MSAAFGVHFGCTSACLAVYKDGKTDVVANDLGDRTTPCIVAFTDVDQPVGAAAKQGLIRNATNTVSNVKKLVGRKYSDPAIKDSIAKSTAKVISQGGLPHYQVEYDGSSKYIDPAMITKTIYRKMLDNFHTMDWYSAGVPTMITASTMLLIPSYQKYFKSEKAGKETAQSHGGKGIKDAVLTVPLSFGPEQKRAIRNAATGAGFSVLRLISEPAAATLAYDIGQTDIHEDSNVLVYRVGGVSIDATIVRVSNGIYQIIATVSNEDHGGDKFTDALASYLATEFQRQFRCDARENNRSCVKLKMAAEMCKHTLSTLGNAQCAIDSLYDGIDFHANVSRARFESQVSNLLQPCLQIIEQVLQSTDLQTEDIHKVILCGGGTNLPILQKAVGDFFPQADILNNLSPDEIIAIGAAKQAAILVGNDLKETQENFEDTEMDCLFSHICVKVKTSAGVMELQPVFSKGLPIPARKHQTFSLHGDETKFLMEICESDSAELDVHVSRVLAKISLQDLASEAVIKVTFHFRRDGSLHVTCSEPMSGKEASVTIETE